MKMMIYDVGHIEFDGLSLMLGVTYNRKTKVTIFVDPSIPLRVVPVPTKNGNIAVELEEPLGGFNEKQGT